MLVHFDAFLFFLLACHAESIQSPSQYDECACVQWVGIQAEKLREAKVQVKCPALKISLFESQVTFRADLIALPLQTVTNGG